MNLFTTVKLGYNKLGYNELLVIANKKISLVGFPKILPGYSKQHPSYNEQKNVLKKDILKFNSILLMGKKTHFKIF